MEEIIVDRKYFDSIDDEIDAMYAPDGIYDAESTDENGKIVSINKYILPLDSELRKPWKEMNPVLAIEQALELPPPRIGYISKADYKEYGQLALDEMTMAKHKKALADGWFRCPLCRNGSHRYKSGASAICRCCGGFIYGTEASFLGFFTSLNEVSEEKRILAQTRGIVKVKVKQRKDKKIAADKEAANPTRPDETILFDNVKQSDLTKQKKKKEVDHA